MDFNKILFEFNNAVTQVTSSDVELCEAMLVHPSKEEVIVGHIKNSFTRKLFVCIKRLTIQLSEFEDCKFCENKDKLFVEMNALIVIFNWLVANEVGQFGGGDPSFVIYKDWRVALISDYNYSSVVEVEGLQFLAGGYSLN